MDASTAALVGALGGGVVGALATVAGAVVVNREQRRARLDDAVSYIAGVVDRYKANWNEPRADFYARCFEIERSSRSDPQRRAARELRSLGSGASSRELDRLLEDLQDKG
jgi:hypothetical protein